MSCWAACRVADAGKVSSRPSERREPLTMAPSYSRHRLPAATLSDGAQDVTMHRTISLGLLLLAAGCAKPDGAPREVAEAMDLLASIPGLRAVEPRLTR